MAKRSNATTNDHPGRLSDDDVRRLYHILWSIYLFVAKEQGRSHPKTLDEMGAMHPRDLVPLREAAFQPGVVARFVAANPARLSPRDLAVAASWTEARVDMRVFERVLKLGAIVLWQSRVYRVVGIMETFLEMEHPPLPFFTQCALLPFESVITYDGILASYPVSVGPEMRRTFADEYMEAKTQGTIITTPAEMSAPPTAKPTPTRDWTTELNALKQAAKKLRASAADPPATREAFALIRHAIDIAQTVTTTRGGWDERSWGAFERKLKKAVFAIMDIEQKA